MRIRIHASYDSFRDLRRNQVYYIDKTEVIQEYLVNKSNFASSIGFTEEDVQQLLAGRSIDCPVNDTIPLPVPYRLQFYH